MNTLKVGLILGVTIVALLGARQYFQSNDSIHDLVFESFEERSGDMFKEWMKKYDKRYGAEETHYRFMLWSQSYNLVQEHNSKGLSWELETNMFADLTNEEFAALHLGFNHDPAIQQENVQYLDTSEALDGTSWDWRKKGAVTSVKDQKTCGSCYTFSSAAALEGLLYIKKGTLVDLSNQQLLDCTSSYGNQGCGGGLMVPCFKYTKEKGIMRLEDYPYQNKVTTCSFKADKIVYKNTGYVEVPKNDFTQLRAAVKKTPVSVAVEAGTDGFKLYKGGIISANCGTKLDHAILAVGYGSGFWIVKNSWGAAWGEEGYVRIASGSQNNGAGICGINSVNSYPTL